MEKKLVVSLKGENGLMRKRFTGLEKSIDEQKAEIRRLHEAQDSLYATIATHEKDIHAFKEVRGRPPSAPWRLLLVCAIARSDTERPRPPSGANNPCRRSRSATARSQRRRSASTT